MSRPNFKREAERIAESGCKGDLIYRIEQALIRRHNSTVRMCAKVATRIAEENRDWRKKPSAQIARWCGLMGDLAAERIVRLKSPQKRGGRKK